MTEKNKQDKPKTIKMHLIEMLNLLVQIKRTRLDIGHREYNHVIDSELIAAVKRCEVEEQAIFEMSYPLSDPCMLHGYMGVKAYMLNLLYENLFCGKFEKNEIDRIVGVCENNRVGKLSYNLFNSFYLNALICEYLQKDIGTLSLSADDCAAAQKLLGELDEQKQYELLAECSGKVSGSELHNYSAKYFERISPKIMAAVKKKKLSSLLIVE